VVTQLRNHTGLTAEDSFLPATAAASLHLHVSAKVALEWKPLLGPDVVTPHREERIVHPSSSKTNEAVCLYSQKGAGTRMSAPITAVLS
jgi:hypothetical protein